MKCHLLKPCVLAIVLVALPCFAIHASGATRLKSICRIKGQEENTLHGIGLVVGLNGTGDGGSYLPAIRVLGMAMQLMGNPVGDGGPAELKNVKNVALVAVTATVPASGGRQGDRIHCTVSSIGAAKSLEGGRLFLTPLLGPQVESTRVYAFCQGPIQLAADSVPTAGQIHRGCRLEEDFHSPFYTEAGTFTLVLHESHADFEIAQAVADVINYSPLVSGERASAVAREDQSIARALDSVNIQISIPQAYLRDPVVFVSQILSLEVLLETEVKTPARVVMNARDGVIVVGGDVEIGPVVVTHKNIVIETGANAGVGGFVAIHEEQQPPPKLQSLVTALNAIKVPTSDMIDIIKNLQRSGKLHAELIIE